MSWLYSQVLVEEYLAANSLDGAQSVQSNGNHTQQAYCAPDKMTDFSHHSLSGMTFAPLTADRGAELLTWYLEVSHARTSALQGEEQELPESNPACGHKWQESFAKYDPVSYSWKTHQRSLFADLELSLETFPKWGSMRSGVLYQRQKPAHLISEKEFGLLPTPTATDYKGSTPHKVQRRSQNGNGLTLREWLAKYSKSDKTVYPNPGFLEIAMGWPEGWTELNALATDKYHNAQP